MKQDQPCGSHARWTNCSVSLGMSATGPAPDPLADARLALALFLTAPGALGGVSLRGFGPVREQLIEDLRARCKLTRLPPNIDDERLLGGIDLAASLAAGRTIAMPGLLAEAAGGALLVPMAERLAETTAGRLAQAVDLGDSAPGLILLDDGLDHDDAPPAALMERLAFHCDLSAVERLPDVAITESPEGDFHRIALPEDDALASLAATAMALGIASVRPMLFAVTAARAHAALAGRASVAPEDLAVAAKLVLAPRAIQMPASPEPPAQEPDQQQEEQDTNHNKDNQPSEGELEDMVLEAALAAIPPDLLAAMADGQLQRRGTGSAAGKRRKSSLRGRPLGTLPGMPRGGARLALIDTLRTAIPWQKLRRREGDSVTKGVIVRKQDLRIRRFEERAGMVTVFCVDASGSAAFARLAEAKGAVELMLAQAHVTRSEVALIAFRGTGAQLLLPPTRSLTRARRALGDLPGGGGTPLAAGVAMAQELGETITARGRTSLIVLLTDGRANIAADGTAGRAQATDDTQASARAFARAGLDALVIDISPRTSSDAAELAGMMRARFLALPRADANTLHQAVSAARSKAKAA